MSYSSREPFYAHRFVRTLYRNCAPQTIGLEACALLTIVVHCEDATRYRGPVAFYNQRLQDMLGLRKWESLDRARKRAVDAGWLIYEPPPAGRRGAGRYFVTIPK